MENTENTNNYEEDIIKEALIDEEEKEKDFENVIPSFGDCGGEEVDISKVGKQKSKVSACSKDQSPQIPEAAAMSKKAKKKAAYIQENLNAADSQFQEKYDLANCDPAQIKKLIKEGIICFKCKLRAPNYTNKQDKVCKACFMDSVVHRFKMSLRLNLKIWKDDLNLICISGGSSSMALLDLMHEALFGQTSLTQRKMFFKVHILYIDEGRAVYNWPQEFWEQQIKMITEQCEKYEFSYTIIPLESIFDTDCDLMDLKQLSPDEQKKVIEEKKHDYDNHTPLSENFEEIKNVVVPLEEAEMKRDRFRKLMETLPTESSFREDLIFYFKRLLISEFCLKYNFKKALFGTNSHKVATQLLAQICKGRGASIAHEIAFVDDKNFGGKISYMNPMRDFLQKEISLYNHNRQVQIIQQGPLAQIMQQSAKKPQPAPSFGSTDLLIEQFFTRLQDKYNVNTVPTVVRLTNKLKKPEDDEDFQRPYPFCPLCLGVRDNINNLLEVGSTIKSITINKDIQDQEQKPSFITNNKDTPHSVQSSNEWFKTQMEQTLCFGCKRLVISAKDQEGLLKLMPNVVIRNGERTYQSENQ